jgi:PAS domain S-box-containing protein
MWQDLMNGHPETDPGRSDERWESDSRFRAVFDNASIGMALTARTGRFLNTNHAFCKMLGYETGELDGMHFRDITHPDDRADSQEILRMLVSGEAKSTHWEKRYLHRDGAVVWARINVAPVASPDGELLYMVVQIEDITDRKMAEAAARASEERFKLAFDSAASGMALVDPANGRFVSVNAAGCEMLGYSEEELFSLTIQDVTAPSDREESIERFRTVITGEAPHSRAKLHYLRKDGSTAFGMVSTALVKDSDGRPLHMVANVVDITEQVEAQDQLKQLLASKDQLIASVSHELRTPLTAVLGFAELLRDEPGSVSSEERIEIIESIADQTNDLTNIVEDLLVAARANNDSLTVARVPVNLRAQSAQVLEALGQNGPHGRPELTGPTVKGWGDPARVRQILRNLISNAFRYGGESIELTTYQSGAHACLAVVDDGPGVPPDQHDRIFEPFQRATNREGLTASIGLGLTVSRKLAHLMEGELTYRRENGRSVFELQLVSTEGTRQTD